MQPNSPTLRLIIETALFLIGLTITLILCVPFLIYRQLVKISAKLFQLDLVRIVPPIQTLLANDNLHEDKSSFNIVIWQILEGSLSIEKLQRLVQENLILHCRPDGSLEFPEFQQYFAQYGGYLFFKWDRDFHVNNHVRHLEQRTKVTEKNLKSIVSRLSSAGWTNNRSLWEIVVSTNYRTSEDDNENKSVLIFRLHHSLGDGYSCINFMARLYKADNVLAAAPRINSLSTWEMLLKSITSAIRQPYEYVQLFRSTLGEKHAWKLPSGELRKEFNVVWSSQIQVSTIKEIKNKYHVSFQAVLNSVICGAIRRVMKRTGQDIPDVMSAFLAFPTPNHPGGLSMHANFSAVKLPVGVQDPTTRLKMADDMWMQEVRSSGRWMFHKLSRFGGFLPTSMASLFVNHIVTIGISSFPGVEGDAYCDENKILEANYAIGTGQGSGAALFATFSCFGFLRFVMTIDKTICPDDIDEYFAECIDEEIRSFSKPAFSP